MTGAAGTTINKSGFLLFSSCLFRGLGKADIRNPLRCLPDSVKMRIVKDWIVKNHKLLYNDATAVLYDFRKQTDEARKRGDDMIVLTAVPFFLISRILGILLTARYGIAVLTFVGKEKGKNKKVNEL